MRILPLAFAAALVTTAACGPLLPPKPATPVVDAKCGAAEAFDPQGDVVYAASSDGCVRIERQSQSDGSFKPVRLVAHVHSAFTQNIDVDTDALTYEGNEDGTALVTSDDDVTARISFDPCSGAWSVDMNDGAATLPLVLAGT